MSEFLAHLAAGLVAAWGLAHALPTARVVAGYAGTSRDNRLVVVQEWVAESVAMWFAAALVITVTAQGGSASVGDWVYRIVAGMLFALGVLTAATGARTAVVFFKICPLMLAVCAAVLLAASWTGR